jgi:hypothetical protein
MIYPAYVGLGNLVDSNFDLVVTSLFQLTMACHLTSVAYYFSTIFDFYEMQTGTLLEQILKSLVPIGIMIVPLVFLCVEFYIDQIFFVFQQWYYCFIASGIALLNLLIDYARIELLPIACPNQVSIFHWQATSGSTFNSFENGFIFVVMNATVYLILTAASALKTV